MDEEDREPPRHFGDPHGAHWTAVRPERPEGEETDVEEDYSYNGSLLKIMWDEGAGPLWGDVGLLPDEPEWMRDVLGIGAPLVADLLAWTRGMDELNFGPADPRWQEMTD